MILILIFAEAIGLYGLIVSIIMIFWALAALHETLWRWNRYPIFELGYKQRT
jgi:hypothetical protein